MGRNKGETASKVNAHRALLRRLAARFGWVCWYCGVELVEPYIPLKGTKREDTHRTASPDHIIPKSVGGSNDDDNLALCCVMCNRAKHAFGLEVYLDWLEHIRFRDVSPLILMVMN